MQKNYLLIITAGFALFAMFFGSGNLIYPLGLGVEAKDGFWSASIGLIMTGVLVPFIGLIGVSIASESGRDYFSELGKIWGGFLTTVILCMIGPFGAGPRCILVGSSGIELLAPGLSPWLIYSGISILTFFLLTTKKDPIEVVGRFLTPGLLISLMLVTVYGTLSEHEIAAGDLSSVSLLFRGAKQGYQTMDLLASFFFSGAIISFLRKKVGSNQNFVPLAIKSSILGGGLLAAVYFVFVVLGATYSEQLLNIDPAKRLVVIAVETLGEFALPLASILIFLACLTTLCAVTELFANFISRIVGLSHRLSVAVTLLLTLCFSLLGFAALTGWIGQVLTVCYPGLMVFSWVKLFQNKFKISARWLQLAFWLPAAVAAAEAYL